MEVLKKRKLEPRHEITARSRDSIGDFDLDYDIPDDNFDFIEEEDDFENGDLVEDIDDDLIAPVASKKDIDVTSSQKNTGGNGNSDDPFERIDLEDQILNFIRNNDKADGVSREEILSNFKIEDAK